MIKPPKDAKKLNLQNATVDILEFTMDNLTYYYFDTSLCAAPEPMLNAMATLQLLNNDKKRLIMKNHTVPNGLFPKIKENFDYEVEELEDGSCQVIFAFKTNTTIVTDFEDNHCDG